MSRDIVTAVQAPFLNAFALLERYIDVCPEEIWREKNGGWPVWQQIYHALTALDFFVGQVGTPSDWPFDQATGSLNVVSEQYLTKEAAKKLATEAKARVDIYLAGLSDADLAASPGCPPYLVPTCRMGPLWACWPRTLCTMWAVATPRCVIMDSRACSNFLRKWLDTTWRDRAVSQCCRFQI